MPPSIEIRWIAAFILAGVVACGSSDTEDFFDSVPNVQAGAPGAGHGGAAGSVATGGGAGRVASGGSAGSTTASGGAGGMPGAGGSEPGTGGAGAGGGAGTGGSASGAGGDSSGTGGTSGSGGAPPLGGAPGAGTGGLAGGGGNGALAGAGGGDAGSPAAGGMAGRGGSGGSGPAQCDAVLATATSALAEAQECNLALSSLQCEDLVDTVCGCKTPVARIDSMATKTYLAALAALKSCPIDCPAVPCDNPTSGTCRRNESGFTDGHCVGDDTSFTPF